MKRWIATVLCAALCQSPEPAMALGKAIAGRTTHSNPGAAVHLQLPLNPDPQNPLGVSPVASLPAFSPPPVNSPDFPAAHPDPFPVSPMHPIPDDTLQPQNQERLQTENSPVPSYDSDQDDQTQGRPGPSHLHEQNLDGLLKQAADPSASHGSLRATGQAIENYLTLKHPWEVPVLNIVDPTPKGASILYARQHGVSGHSGSNTPGPEIQNPGSTLPNSMLPALVPFAFFSIPLSAWPDIRFYAAIATGLSAFIFFNFVTNGILARWLLRPLQNRSLAKNLERHLHQLFDIPTERGHETQAISLFLRAWLQSDNSNKPELLQLTAQQPELLGHKLIAAYLAETDNAALSMLQNALLQHSTLYPIEPILEQVLKGRKKLPWLAQGQASRRLSRLAQLLHLQLPASNSWWHRLSLLVTAVIVAALLALTTHAWFKTHEYHGHQEREAQAALEDRFAKHMYIFDLGRYRVEPEKMAQEVLPALRNWDRDDPQHWETMRRAVRILENSVDPAADDVLEALLEQFDYVLATRRIEHAALVNQIQDELLSALLKRDSEGVWKFLQDYLSKHESTLHGARRILRMIELASDLSPDKNFHKLFYFLKSSNPIIQEAASQKISQSLGDAQNGPFLARLQNIFQRHQDPEVHLWVGWFLLNQLHELNPDQVNVGEVDRLMQQIVHSMLMADGQRVVQLGQLRPGQALPAPFTARVFHMMADALSNQVSAAQAQAVQTQYHQMATILIQEGNKLFPGLRVRLHKSNVMRTPPEDNQPYDHEDRAGSSGPPSAAYYSYSASFMRSMYKRRHLNDFLKDLQAEAVAVHQQGGLSLEQREFLARAFSVVSQMQQAAAQVNIPSGDTPGGRAADELNEILFQGYNKFYYRQFVEAGQKAQVMPKEPKTWTIEDLFFQTYSQEDLQKIHAFLEELLAQGQGWHYAYDSQAQRWGLSRRELTSQERQYLIQALDAVERLRGKYFPDPGAGTLGNSSLGRNFLALKKALASAGSQACADVEKAIAKAYEESKFKNAFLARLRAAQESYASDPKFQLWAREFLAQKGGKAKVQDGAGTGLPAKAELPAFFPPMLLGSMGSMGFFGVSLESQLQDLFQSPYFFPAVVALIAIAIIRILWRSLSPLLRSSHKVPQGSPPPEHIRSRLKVLRQFAVKHGPSSVIAGIFRSRRLGQGMEFHQLDPYQPGDPIHLISAEASAQAGEYQVRKHVEEKEEKVLLVVDMSGSGRIGTGRDKLTVIRETGAFLALFAEVLNLKIGAYFVTDRKEEYIEPGKMPAEDLAYKIMEFQPKGRGTNLKLPMDFANEQLLSSSIVIVLSDFEAEDFEISLLRTAQRHSVRAIRVNDRADQEALSINDILDLEDAETGQTITVDPKAVRSQHQDRLDQRARELKALLAQEPLQKPILLTTDGNHLEELIKNFRTEKK